MKTSRMLKNIFDLRSNVSAGREPGEEKMEEANDAMHGLITI